MKKRQTRKARELQEQPSQCYSLRAMMKNGKVIAARRAQKKAQAEGKPVDISNEAGLASLVSVPATIAPSVFYREAFDNL